MCASRGQKVLDSSKCGLLDVGVGNKGAEYP